MSFGIARIATRPARLSTAIKIAFAALILEMIVVGTQTVLAGGPGTTPAPALAIEVPTPPAKLMCREETVTLDEGYGLQGHKSEVICAAAR
jgi:hypothetical protein